MKLGLKNAQRSDGRFGTLFRPSTIGDPITTDITHTSSIVMNMRKLFLCFAYLIGCVTAIYLRIELASRRNFLFYLFEYLGSSPSLGHSPRLHRIFQLKHRKKRQRKRKIDVEKSTNWLGREINKFPLLCFILMMLPIFSPNLYTCGHIYQAKSCCSLCSLQCRAFFVWPG